MGKLYTGVDLHKRQFTVFYMNETGKGKYMEYPTTEIGYQAFIKTLEKARKKLVDDIQVAVESTGNTRYFKSQVEKHGFPVKVVNTMRFKVVNESANKTDKHDAKTIAEFLSKDMLPEVSLRSEKGERLRRLLTSREILVRTNVKLKNQIHGILLGLGIDSKNGELNTKKGRKSVIESINENGTKTIVKLLVSSIESILESISKIEDSIRSMVEKDKMVSLLLTIPGTGLITAATVRAQIDNIKRFKQYTHLSAYAGLVPWVQCSDQTIHYGRITKRGPSELRTALIQMVLGMIRCKSEKDNRYMCSYRNLKKMKGSGKALVATARKFTKMIWTMLRNGDEFNSQKANVLYKLLDRSAKKDHEEVQPIPA